MEAEERPAKLRKLVHGVDEDYGDENRSHGSNESNTDPSKATHPPVNAVSSASGKIEGDSGEDFNDTGSKQEAAANQLSSGDLAPQISKNQLKKLRKREEWEAGRDYRKAKRKQKATEKKARKREAREEQAENLSATGDVRKQPRVRHVKLPVTILIDCGFDTLMVEKETISLGSQLTRSYSDNHHAPFQAHLAISSWGGQLRERFDTVLNKHYLNWKGVRFEEDDFAIVAERAKEFMTGKTGGKLAGIFEKYRHQVQPPISTKDDKSKQAAVESNGASQDTANDVQQSTAISNNQPVSQEVAVAITEGHCKSPDEPQPEGEIIYLSSDSPDTLTELKPYSTYIVGGLVDKNRHKGICYQTALRKGIKTAKLPIGEYMNMQSRSVLATNHVVEIMIRWLECGDWGEAFMKVIPKRKGGTLKEEDRLNDGQ